MNRVTLDTSKITDWDTFHDVFSKLFGFPDYYGRNLDAWDECMGDLDDPELIEPTFRLEPGEELEIEVSDSEGFKARCPDQFQALVNGVVGVNQAYQSSGTGTVIRLSFQGKPS